MAVALCRACKQPVEWVESENGRRMPIDPNPDPKGNLVRIGMAEVVNPSTLRHERVPIMGVVKADDPTPAARYISHFATCPHADKLRRKPSRRPRAGEQRP